MLTAHPIGPSQSEPTPRSWLREVLIVVGVVAFGLFAISLPSRAPAPPAAAPIEIGD